jgi:hypothetical protein
MLLDLQQFQLYCYITSFYRFFDQKITKIDEELSIYLYLYQYMTFRFPLKISLLVIFLVFP